MSSSAPLELGKPAALEIADDAFSPDAAHPSASSLGSSHSDVSPLATRTAPQGRKRPAPSPGTEPSRTSARRSLKQRGDGAAEDDAVSAATASAPPSVLPSPVEPADRGDAPFAEDEDSKPAQASRSPAYDRKIWMRACNECGFELHVRRMRCTECGAVQMSKRQHALAEQQKNERTEAASQLALIAEAPGPAPEEVATHAAASPSKHPGAASPVVPPVSPAPSQASVVSQLARLTPEQIVKLRRMQKLRALLSKLPPGVTLPAPKPAPRAGDAAAADAITMLASVACM